MPQYFSIHKYLLQCGAHTLACRVETSLRPPDAEEFSLASGAGLHPAGRFPTGLFVLSSPVREPPMKSARSLQSRHECSSLSPVSPDRATLGARSPWIRRHRERNSRMNAETATLHRSSHRSNRCAPDECEERHPL